MLTGFRSTRSTSRGLVPSQGEIYLRVTSKNISGKS